MKPQRCFIVGCPRSGTTLLQAMLASHPAVFSFPETHFFAKVWGRALRMRALGVVSPRAAARTLDELLKYVEWAGVRPPIPRFWPFFRPYGKAFTALVDAACVAAEKSMWVEKTPAHLHHLAEISRCVPDASIIHVVRDGREVVASIYELCETDPTRWIGQFVSKRTRDSLELTPHSRVEMLLRAISARWVRDVALTRSCLSHPRHLVVAYDELVGDPEATLQKICRFLGLSYTKSMLRYQSAASKVTGWRGSLPHMRGPFQALGIRSKKFDDLLASQEQELVKSLLPGQGDVSWVFARTERHDS